MTWRYQRQNSSKWRVSLLSLLWLNNQACINSLSVPVFTSQRRHQYASTGPHRVSSSIWLSSLEDHTVNGTHEGTAPPPSESECPFSKAFPRYRLDLTRAKRQSPKSLSSWFSSPFQGLSQSLQLSKLQRQFGDDLVCIPHVEGISAISALFGHAAGLLESSKMRVLLALPNASPQLVQNWVEIMQWMGTKSDAFVEGTAMVDTKLISTVEGDLLVVQIERIGGKPASLSAKSQMAGIVNERTRAWVKRVLVEQGICPFTKSSRKSGQGLADVGVPVGSIAYHASAATNPIALFADTWKAIVDMIQAGPGGKDGVSSILLAAPGFDDDFDIWSGPIFAMLEASVVAAQAEPQVGIVCFHPAYATPDGSSWPGFGHMHSVPRLEQWHQASSPETLLSTTEIAAGGAWQRRTPHATINVLRADQLEAAESQRSSGDLYAANIERLVGASGIGSAKLAKDLEHERQIGK